MLGAKCSRCHLSARGDSHQQAPMRLHPCGSFYIRARSRLRPRRTPPPLHPSRHKRTARTRAKGAPSSASTPSTTSNSGRPSFACTRSSPTVDPKTALAVGLKVDVDALPSVRDRRVAARQRGPHRSGDHDRAAAAQCDRRRRRARWTSTGQLTSIGITCALCHSTVDDSLMTGIGHRLDGWVNRDLNVGAILSLSPVLDRRRSTQNRGPARGDPADTIRATMRSTA